MRGFRPRLAPSGYRGRRRFSLTFCVHQRRPVFRDGETVDLVWTQLLRAARRHLFAVPAYCFMPDHLHLLVEGVTAGARLEPFVHAAKQYSAFAYTRRAEAPLWQRSYYDHALRDDESTQQVVRYLLENPIRAGLVLRVEDYPYLGSEVYSREQLLKVVWER